MYSTVRKCTLAHMQQESDSIRIKVKIIDDQTETIRRLKEVGCFPLFHSSIHSNMQFILGIKASLLYDRCLLMYSNFS